MKINILTLFPQVFIPYLSTSMMKKAQDNGLVEFEIVDIRNFGEGKHQTVDDRPYGGGAGMILRADILAKAWEFATRNSSLENSKTGKRATILMSASGTPYKQSKAQSLAKLNHLIIICGHYEGIDQRFIDKYVNEEISIGDYVLTGGEIPAMVVADSVTRLLPGVLKKESAAEEESFSPALSGMLEYPHYTRPEVFEMKKIPEILLSGNHQEIKKWRQEKSLKKTKKIRPDLLN